MDGSGNIFERSKTQYETYSAENFIVATDHGIANDATGDQTAAIKSLLSGNIGKPIFFPAGIYLVEKTIVIPVGSIIIGEGWSK